MKDLLTHISPLVVSQVLANEAKTNTFPTGVDNYPVGMVYYLLDGGVRMVGMIHHQ